MATTAVLGAWDCGTVLTVSLRGRFVCVVHVASPATGAVTHLRTAEHVLSNKRKLGQAYDGMMELMSFSGREQCFAILTTLKEWKIIWLPTCDASAAASDLPPGSGNATLAAPAEQEISSSGVIPHDHPLLVKMSVIEKCTASRVSPVPLLSTSHVHPNAHQGLVLDAAGRCNGGRLRPETIICGGYGYLQKIRSTPW
jgi:hypothetical protein